MRTAQEWARRFRPGNPLDNLIRAAQKEAYDEGVDHLTKKEPIYEYVEPHMSGGTCIIRMTRSQAIEWAKRCNPRYCEDGLSDEVILEDFITIHWAAGGGPMLRS